MEEICERGRNINFEAFLGSLHLLLFYLCNHQQELNDNIKNILSSKPEYLVISEECSEFLNDDEEEIITVEKFLNVYFLVELLCFELPSLNLNEKFKQNLSENDNKKINELLKTIDDKKIKSDLTILIRRFIFRYLIGNQKENDTINPQNLLIDEILSKDDLFINGEKNIDKNTIKKALEEYKLIVGNSYFIYDMIGKDEQKIIQNIKHFEDEEDHEESEDNEYDGNDNYYKRGKRY